MPSDKKTQNAAVASSSNPPAKTTEAIATKLAASSAALDFLAPGRLLSEGINYDSLGHDESEYLHKRRRMLNLIRRQTYVISALVLLIILVTPYLRPYYQYWARPESAGDKKIQLLPMDEPNLTDKAVLSWIEASITEILTFGFGDFDRRILSQKHRFTSVGWDSFIQSIRDQDMRSEFKLRQLVLTTAPAEAPVIVSKGIDADMQYTWTVEMPIVMTYTTNNNVRSEKRSIVSIKVTRVPSKESVRGIGIKMWRMIG